MDIAEINRTNDDIALLKLRERDDMQDEFGISRVQRVLRWGYNRAARAVERALHSGSLVRSEQCKYHYHFSNEE